MMSEIPINTKEIATVRISAKVKQINLEVLLEHLNERIKGFNGHFTNPDCPNRFIGIWRGNKIIFTRNEIRMMVPLTLKEKVIEDFRKFIDEELELR